VKKNRNTKNHEGFFRTINSGFRGKMSVGEKKKRANSRQEKNQILVCGQLCDTKKEKKAEFALEGGEVQQPEALVQGAFEGFRDTKGANTSQCGGEMGLEHAAKKTGEADRVSMTAEIPEHSGRNRQVSNGGCHEGKGSVMLVGEYRPRVRGHHHLLDTSVQVVSLNSRGSLTGPEKKKTHIKNRGLGAGWLQKGGRK